jgi:hypothetical protein
MRVDTEDFRIKQSEEQNKFYTLSGNESFCDDGGFPRMEIESEHTFAKAVKSKLSKSFGSDDLSYRFYIKTDPNKNILNPIETYSLKTKEKSSFINKTCKIETVFSEVAESVFNQYINFLKTNNTKWLNSAQRELK